MGKLFYRMAYLAILVSMAKRIALTVFPRHGSGYVLKVAGCTIGAFDRARQAQEAMCYIFICLSGHGIITPIVPNGAEPISHQFVQDHYQFQVSGLSIEAIPVSVPKECMYGSIVPIDETVRHIRRHYNCLLPLSSLLPKAISRSHGVYKSH